MTGPRDERGVSAGVNVVSPEFPCGAAWLANALIELSVPVRELWGFDTAREWSDNGDGSSTYVADDMPWRQTLAALRPGRRFRFDPSTSARFSHHFPCNLDADAPVILMVRDPRDALYSEWRRHQRNLALDPSIAFTDFLARPFFASPASVIDTLWLHLRAWTLERERTPDRVLLVRFEDWKREPRSALARIARFAGVQRSAEAIAMAAGASDVAILRHIEATLTAADPGARQFNRRGRAHEWMEAWEPEWFRVFDDRWHAVFDALGYEPCPGALP